MAINKPRIAGKPAVRRSSFLDQPVSLSQSEYGVATGAPPFLPTLEGQMACTWYLEGYRRITVMHIGVDINGTLAWKQIRTGRALSAYTGQPIDPIYD